MTREEFIAGYCERSGFPEDYVLQNNVALPCACSEDGCTGWAMVEREELQIKSHYKLYAPPMSS